MCDGHWSFSVQPPLGQALPPSHPCQGTELPARPDLTSCFGVGKSPAAAAAAQGVGLRPKPTFTDLKSKRVTLLLGFSMWHLTIRHQQTIGWRFVMSPECLCLYPKGSDLAGQYFLQ